MKLVKLFAESVSICGVIQVETKRNIPPLFCRVLPLFTWRINFMAVRRYAPALDFVLRRYSEQYISLLM